MDQSRYLKAAQDLINGRQVQRTSHSHLAFKNFLDDDGVWVTAIEQNPTKSSEWAVLSREGHTVIQFRRHNKYVAVSVDGELRVYQSVL